MNALPSVKASLVLLFCWWGLHAQAQEHAKPSFAFKTAFVNDTLFNLEAIVAVPKNGSLYSVTSSSGDGFMSALVLDTAGGAGRLALGMPVEKGRSVIDSNGYKTYSDTVFITFPIGHAQGMKGFAKGSFVWLMKSGGAYPSGEDKFSVPVPERTSVSTDGTGSGMPSVWSIFLLTFFTGLLAIVTPCVFPLVPVTVSFFLKKSGSRKAGIRNAALYSGSIIAIYTVPTLLLTMLFGNAALYTLATSPYSNLFFFVVFVVFATSFFGAFEISLPNSWANKADARAGKGGVVGIFFMALTLVVVSFSCTGPIVGTLLGQTSSQGIGLAPIVGMFGFGCGLAIPFSFFALFPSLLGNLPKSGGWLNSVKVSFGFIELALALKFLSNVDLAYHWHLLDRDVFLALWIVVFSLLGAYLLGKLKFSHDSVLAYISVPRLFFAIASFSFAVYLVPGLWGAPLRHLSGFVPPSTTQDFNLDELRYGTLPSASPDTKNNGVPLPSKYIDKLHVPFGLRAYFDLDEGMAAAKVANKPIMLDFTGHSCANCRKMEEQVWKKPEVLKRLKEDFIIVSLYVDESTELPEAEHVLGPDGNRITTVGEKNLAYEIKKFGFNAQPLYMFLDLNGKPLSDVRYGYDPDTNKFIAHLDKMKAAFAASR